MWSGKSWNYLLSLFVGCTVSIHCIASSFRFFLNSYCYFARRYKLYFSSQQLLKFISSIFFQWVSNYKTQRNAWKCFKVAQTPQWYAYRFKKKKLFHKHEHKHLGPTPTLLHCCTSAIFYYYFVLYLTKMPVLVRLSLYRHDSYLILHETGHLRQTLP